MAAKEEAKKEEMAGFEKPQETPQLADVLGSIKDVLGFDVEDIFKDVTGGVQSRIDSLKAEFQEVYRRLDILLANQEKIYTALTGGVGVKGSP